jgi:hypothetical protein
LEFEKDAQPYRVDIKYFYLLKHYLLFLRKTEPEEIPKDWDPFRKVKEYLSKGNAGTGVYKNQKYQKLNPEKRAAMLGEDKGTIMIRLYH